MTDNIHSHAASPMLRALAAIAYDAGAIILKHYGPKNTNEIVARRKDDESPVTAADEEAERFILKRLAQLAPDVPVLAEEAVASGKIPKVGHRFFLVDPLDGDEGVHQPQRRVSRSTSPRSSRASRCAASSMPRPRSGCSSARC